MDLDLSKLCSRTRRGSAPVISSTRRGHCVPLGMVAGHYQPLADDGARWLSCTVRPNLSSAVGSEDKDKQVDLRATSTFSSLSLHSLVFGLCGAVAPPGPKATDTRKREPSRLP